MSHHAEESIHDSRPVGEGLPPSFTRLRNASLLVGLIGLALMLLSLLGDPQHTYRSWLFAYIYWFAIPCGCMVFIMMSHLTGGEYAVIYRRFGEAAFMTLPVMLILWIPFAFGLRFLFPWAHIGDFTGAHGNVAFAKAMIHRQSLYNQPIFIIRNLIYYVILLGIAFGLRGMSLRLDKADDPYLRLRLRRLSAPGIILYFIVMTCVSFDYQLSRETNWYSYIIGFVFVIGQAEAGIAFLTLSVCYFADRRIIRDVLRPQHLNDYGNLMLAVVILWIYTSFAQLLVAWQGNMKVDVGYYAYRGFGPISNGWRWVALALLVLNFLLPFILLLMRELKRKIRTTAWICAVLLIVRILAYAWDIIPSGPHRTRFERSPGQVYWTDFAAWFGIGGIFMATYLWNLARQPLLPRNATDQPQLITHGAGQAPHAA